MQSAGKHVTTVKRGKLKKTGNKEGKYAKKQAGKHITTVKCGKKKKTTTTNK